MKKRLMILCTLVLALAFCFGATAEEPHGDGNGIVSRPLLASMYKCSCTVRKQATENKR